MGQAQGTAAAGAAGAANLHLSSEKPNPKCALSGSLSALQLNSSTAQLQVELSGQAPG